MSYFWILAVSSGCVPIGLYIYSKAVASKPRLYAKSGEFRKAIEKFCPSIRKDYIPPWWCPFGMLQTAVRQLLKSCPSLPYEREVLAMKDGGQVALDWFNTEHTTDDTPIVIILPGLTGSTFESYVLHLVMEIDAKLGYRSVVFNNRGCGGIEVLTPRMYCAANTEDFTEVVAHVKNKYPKGARMACGFSLGGMILFNYCAGVNSREESGLEAGMIISSPWNTEESTKSLERWLPKIVFNQRLARNLCDRVKVAADQLSQKVPDFANVLKSTTIREFDSRCVVPMFGYKDVWDYYRDAALHTKVDKIKVPLLCLNAADDCFAPAESIPVDEIEQSENVASIITQHGGHIAFMKRVEPSAPGLIEEILVDYARMVFDFAAI